MKEERLADMVVEYAPTEMDITVCVTEVGAGAHTPAAGPMRQYNICTNSGAGVYVNNNGDDIIVIQSQVYRPDMRKRVPNHKSPKPKFGSINIFEYIIKIRNKWLTYTQQNQ